MAKTCGENAGFLIASPCQRKAVNKCLRCAKPICETHSRASAVRAGQCCITCHRQAGAKYENRTDDPYLYSGYYYDDYYSTYAYGSDDWDDDRGAFNQDDSGSSDDQWESDFDGS